MKQNSATYTFSIISKWLHCDAGTNSYLCPQVCSFSNCYVAPWVCLDLDLNWYFNHKQWNRSHISTPSITICMKNDDGTLWFWSTADHSVVSHINNKQTTTDNPCLKQSSHLWLNQKWLSQHSRNNSPTTPQIPSNSATLHTSHGKDIWTCA